MPAIVIKLDHPEQFVGTIARVDRAVVVEILLNAEVDEATLEVRVLVNSAALIRRAQRVFFVLETGNGTKRA